MCDFPLSYLLCGMKLKSTELINWIQKMGSKHDLLQPKKVVIGPYVMIKSWKHDALQVMKFMYCTSTCRCSALIICSNHDLRQLKKWVCALDQQSVCWIWTRNINPAMCIGFRFAGCLYWIWVKKLFASNKEIRVLALDIQLIYAEYGLDIGLAPTE